MASVSIDDSTLGLLLDQASAYNLSLDAYLRRLAQNGVNGGTTSDRGAPKGPHEPRRAAWQQFVAAMRSWGETRLPRDHFVDDSRERIYEGRGE